MNRPAVESVSGTNTNLKTKGPEREKDMKNLKRSRTFVGMIGLTLMANALLAPKMARAETPEEIIMKMAMDAAKPKT